jgi:Family of unknown function (DUF6209)
MSTIRFLSNWTQEQDGELHPGEQLTIEYDIARLPQCRAKRYGRDAWSIVGYVRFHPGEQLQSVLLSSGSAEVEIPADARKVELWFNNTDHTGCSAWDSRYGQNYWLDVTAASVAGERV